jgi:CRISPR-associated protein Cas2
MPIQQRMPFLLCYDIANPKRLQKIHRVIKNYAVPIQYSVFLGRFTSKELKTLLSTLDGLIKSSEDDIRIYPLNRQPNIQTLGQYGLPPEALLEDSALIL